MYVHVRTVLNRALKNAGRWEGLKRKEFKRYKV